MTGEDVFMGWLDRPGWYVADRVAAAVVAGIVLALWSLVAFFGGC